MKTNFIQPDPYTCVPTSFAYLLYKKYDVNFKEILAILIKECYTKYTDIAENGMEFEQIQEIGDTLGFPSWISDKKPVSSAYLTGVTRLPMCNFKYNEFIKEAIKEGSLTIEEKYFVYPFGHALAVFEKDNSTAAIFDSLLGIEMNISLSELKEYLETPTQYLYL
jgi:hypothetical protein